jgi:membrane protein implicated in regulation of membrane protease activity
MAAFWLWWIAAAVLIGAELLTGTYYLLAVGTAVALGGVAAWIGLETTLQWAVAAVLGVVLTIVAHRWRLGHALPPVQPSFDIGQSVDVLHWNSDGTARVTYRGTQWTAEPAAADTPRSKSMVIVGMKGSTLVIGPHAPR